MSRFLQIFRRLSRLKTTLLHFKTLKITKNKVTKGVGILSKLRFLFLKSSLLLLYYALIQPHLLFALSLWGTTSSSYLKPLQLLQNKTVGIICNCKRASSTTPPFHKLEILKINELCQYEIGKLMFKHSKKLFHPVSLP